jgi:hypothetical protein
MARPKMKKSERILRQIERVDGMTTREIRDYLLRCDGYSPKKIRSKGKGPTYTSILYGTSKQQGILDRFCVLDLNDGKYRVVRTIEAPFTPLRAAAISYADQQSDTEVVDSSDLFGV